MKNTCIGYLAFITYGNVTTETHYAILPDGTVLCSTRNPLRAAEFGRPGTWNDACASAEYVQENFEFIGHYPIPEVY